MLYRLCEATTAEELQTLVNVLVREGWRPIGGVAVTVSHQTANWWFYQAMIHETAKPERPGDWELS